MENTKSAREEDGGNPTGKGGTREPETSEASGSGAPTEGDQGFDEERQRRQENWSPAGQTGFDNEDVIRQDEIYPKDSENSRS